MNYPAYIVAASLTAAISTVTAEDRSLLFGGGPNPERSQYSIESNVIWFDEVLKKSQFNNVTTMFGSNLTNPTEIAFNRPFNSDNEKLLNRILKGADFNNTVFRPSVIGSDNNQPVTRDNFLAVLAEEVAALQPSDSLFITYSGHGGEAANPKDSFFYLWDDTSASVTDVQSVMSNLNDNASVRFVLPQCYSGAFNRLAFHQLEPQKGALGGAPICGFTSVPDDLISEGCTASVDTGDYRDYASFFYAALTSQDRDGSPINTSADFDDDGNISLLEAHRYAYAYSRSTDIPRSTSEDFLMSTVNWQTRWSSYLFTGADNEYSQLLPFLAYDFEHEPGTRGFLQETRGRLTQRISSASALSNELHDLLFRFDRDSAAIKVELNQLWPALRESDGAVILSETENSEINIWLNQHKDRVTLLSLLNNIDESVTSGITAEREASRIARIQRLITMSRLHEELMENGEPQDIADYEALQHCESWVPPLS